MPKEKTKEETPPADPADGEKTQESTTGNKSFLELRDVDIPSNNTYYRNFRGHMTISPKGRSFKQEVSEKCRGCSKVLGPVVLSIEFRFRDKRRRDLDNYFKALFDACKDRLFEDDSEIVAIHSYKRIGCKDDAGVTVEVVSANSKEVPQVSFCKI